MEKRTRFVFYYINFNLLSLHSHGVFHSKWLCKIESILNDTGLSEYWLTQNVPFKTELSKMVKSRLIHQYKQSWYESVFGMPKCINYRIIKVTHGFEKYLIELPIDLRRALCNFRCTNHKLPIEKGRFWGVDRDDRICDLCDNGNLGDEFHYLFECSFFWSERKPNKFIVNPNSIKYFDLFNSDDQNIIFRLAKFCKIVLSVVN